MHWRLIAVLLIVLALAVPASPLSAEDAGAAQDIRYVAVQGTAVLDLAPAPENSLYVAGRTGDGVFLERRGVLAATPQWRTTRRADKKVERSVAVAAGPDGGVYLAWLEEEESEARLTVVRFGPDGAVWWERAVAFPGLEAVEHHLHPLDLAAGADGDAYAVVTLQERNGRPRPPLQGRLIAWSADGARKGLDYSCVTDCGFSAITVGARGLYVGAQHRRPAVTEDLAGGSVTVDLLDANTGAVQERVTVDRELVHDQIEGIAVGSDGSLFLSGVFFTDDSTMGYWLEGHRPGAPAWRRVVLDYEPYGPSAAALAANGDVLVTLPRDDEGAPRLFRYAPDGTLLAQTDPLRPPSERFILAHGGGLVAMGGLVAVGLGVEQEQAVLALVASGTLETTPTPTGTPEPTATPTPTPTPSPAPTSTPTPFATPTPAPSPTVAPSPTPTQEPTPPAPTAVLEPTATPTPVPTPAPSPTPGPTATPTPSPTAEPLPTPTPFPAFTSTPSPTTEPLPTQGPGLIATPTPTLEVLPTPTATPTPVQVPTPSPTPPAPGPTPEFPGPAVLVPTPSPTPTATPTSRVVAPLPSPTLVPTPGGSGSVGRGPVLPPVGARLDSPTETPSPTPAGRTPSPSPTVLSVGAVRGPSDMGVPDTSGTGDSTGARSALETLGDVAVLLAGAGGLSLLWWRRHRARIQ